VPLFSSFFLVKSRIERFINRHGMSLIAVNAGDFCVLGGANISGGVRVNDGGILIVCGSVINGGFIANGAANLGANGAKWPWRATESRRDGAFGRNTTHGLVEG
jgi:hypothetical protein